MASLTEITYDILSSYAGTSRISDEVDIDVELLEFKIINQRNYLIRQDQSKGRSLSDNIVQTLSCVEVQPISISECPCQVPSDCTILRSVLKLPKFLELYQKDLVTKVSGTAYTSKGFSIVSFARASVAGTSKYTKNNTKVFFHNQYLYLINPPEATQTITVSGVFEDPRDVAGFTNCSGTPCYSVDDAFPLSSYMIPTLKQLVIKDLGLLIQQKPDDLGNEHYVKAGEEGKA